ncbi:15946_t:CDS:2, partial [Gigaspora rosea]
LVWKEAGQAMIQNVNPYSKWIKVFEKERNSSDIDTSDAHKFVLTEAVEDTWAVGDRSSRIDYVWVSDNFKSNTIKAGVKDISTCTISDHKLIFVELYMGLNLRKQGRAQRRKSRRKRINLDLDKASKEDWENYRL